MSRRAQRIADNEQRFRVFNDEVHDVREQHGYEASFSCECGRADCTHQIDMSLEDYEWVRHDPHWFLVVPGHEISDVERVVDDRRTYLVIEKTGESARLVE